MVGADPHGCTVFFANSDQGHKSVTDPFQFFSVGLVRIIVGFKFFPVRIIPGINSNLFNDGRCYCCRIRCKMNIGHQWSIKTPGPDTIPDRFQVLCLIDTGGGDTYNFTSCLNHPYGLGNSSLCIHGVRGGHGLDTYGIISPNAYIPDHDAAGFPSLVLS